MIKKYWIYLLIGFTSGCLTPEKGLAQKNSVPVMAGSNEAKPFIFNCTESINPGETVGIQGATFGTDPQIWMTAVKGNETDLKPQVQLSVLTHSDIFVAGTIPETIPSGLYALWVINGKQLSQPVFVNRAKVWSAEFDQIMPGTAFRLFGRNLQLKGSNSRVSFVDPNGRSFEAQVVKGDAYTLEIVAPKQLVAGVKYNLNVTNGAGGKYGENQFDEALPVREVATDPFKLDVPWGADFNFTSNIYNVKTDKRLSQLAKGDGIANDRAAIQEAIDKSGESGGVVFLPAGTYKLVYSSGSGITMKSRVVLLGEGKDKTTIKYGYGKPFSTERVKAAYGWTLGWPDSRTEGMGMVWQGLVSTSGLISLSVVNVNESGSFVHTIKDMPEGGTKIVLKDCGFDFNSGWGLALVNVDKLLVTGCQLKSTTTDVRGINAPTRTWPWDFKNSSNMIIRNNNYTYNAGRFGANGCHHALFENNTFLRDGDHQAKGETGGINLDYVTDMVILGNSFLVKGAPIVGKNQGETILSQGGDPNQMTVGIVTHATATTIMDRKQEYQDFTDRISTSWQYAVHPMNYTIAIVNGVGTGQWRTIMSNNDTILTVDRPWDVIPAPGSKYVITQWSAYQLLVKDNILKDNHQGIMMYCGGSDVAIVNNKLINSGGIYLRSDQRLLLKRYNLSWNTLVEGNEMIDTDGRRAAFVSMLLAQAKEERLFGVGTICLEVRRNMVQAFVPNVTKSGIKGEGYFNCMGDGMVKNPMFDPKTPGILGTIFENNTAVNTESSYIIGSAAHHTIILKAKNTNVTAPVKDMVNEQTKIGAQFTITDLK
jgi:hypothetical protein